MGHEIAVTPLQLAMAHAAVANGGQWLPPRLIKRIHASLDWQPQYQDLDTIVTHALAWERKLPGKLQTAAA